MKARPQPGIHPGIQFAWETDNLEDNVSRIASMTQVLVICGYSFPYFNKDVDHLLLDAMKNSLEAIYIQVHPDDFEEVRARIIRAFWGPVKIPVAPVPGIEQFYIPSELE
jgi:hypothetical protein